MTDSRAKRLGLEPMSVPEGGGALTADDAVLSIAISLKRIADAEEAMLLMHERMEREYAELKASREPQP